MWEKITVIIVFPFYFYATKDNFIERERERRRANLLALWFFFFFGSLLGRTLTDGSCLRIWVPTSSKSCQFQQLRMFFAKCTRECNSWWEIVLPHNWGVGIALFFLPFFTLGARIKNSTGERKQLVMHI